MERLLYISVPTEALERVLLDIVRNAEQHNEINGISGMLVFCDYAYCQLLEGPTEAVSKLFKNIEKDPRHRVLAHDRRSVKRRSIGANLPMGYAHMAMPMHYVEDFQSHSAEAAELLIAKAREDYPTASRLEEILTD